MKKILAITIFLSSLSARADILLDVGATYLSDSLNTPTATSSSGYFYNIGFLFNWSKTTFGGWNYSGLNYGLTTTASTSFSSTDTGPYLKWYFGKGNLYSLSFAYNIQSKATFSDGTTNETWQGSSYWLQMGVNPEVKENLHIGVSLNYFAANYSKKVVNSVESSASNSRTWIFPMFMITKQW